MNVSTDFNPGGGCAGTIDVLNRRVAQGTLAYHVAVSNGTVALDEAYSYRDYPAVSYFETPGSGRGQKSRHGGMVVALQAVADGDGVGFRRARAGAGVGGQLERE